MATPVTGRVLARSFSALLLAGAVVAVPAALAQMAEPPDSARRSIDEDDEDNTPPDKYAEEANESLNSMRVSLQKGLDEVKKAREEKDAVRLTCVNEPVAAMKGVLRVAEDANVDLQEAVATSQTADSRRAFRKVKKSKRAMDNLLTDAQNCAGADSSVSTTSVEVTIDEDVVAIDPYYGNPDFFFIPGDALASGDTGNLGEVDGPDVRPPNASGII